MTVEMKAIVAYLVLLASLLPAIAFADQQPAKGKLLVATELVGGDMFAETVVLLLHYDEHGALGIVVNRPTDIEPGELVTDLDAIAGYSGTLFWGGPVHMDSLFALMLTDTPPEGSETIVGSVHQVPFDAGLQESQNNPGSLRLYIGYAGWSAGQLDGELDRGSWYVLPASDQDVFNDDPRTLWKRLSPLPELRTAVP